MDATILNGDVSLSHGSCVWCLTCKRFLRLTVIPGKRLTWNEDDRITERELVFGAV